MRSIYRAVPVLFVTALLLSDGASSTLDGQAPRARQGMVSLDDARLFYEVVGEGDPILVVHGGPGLDHNYLRPGLDVLANRNTLIYYDQRGTGRSAADMDSAAINLDAFMEDLEALRETLGGERVHVLAHSFGSMIALEYAVRHPERVRSLILLSPVEPGSRFREETARRQREARTAEDSTELSRLMTSEGFEARDPATLSRVFALAFKPSMKDPERIGEVNLELLEATAEHGQDVAGFLGAQLSNVEWWDRLSGIEVPALVVHGAHDLAPEDMSRALAEALPAGRLAVLDSGHFPFVEDPTGLLSAVSGFLASVR